ncbi:hypothetical protein SERLA73DRAFT_143420 [Serpula lacrymans var. lacrymans S7.3]|uniref:Uncharacterized protein n=1 Tax=Serpula lacrymans var. lacrymans (strain S7.3) TaxID=936435 RepID=F8Q9S8_SERL3|nr:hypothetical protein SERLA73DRAFT_143420 [Serpula lacrymans var. lacrymans S7.3]
MRIWMNTVPYGASPGLLSTAPVSCSRSQKLVYTISRVNVYSSASSSCSRHGHRTGSCLSAPISFLTRLYELGTPLDLHAHDGSGHESEVMRIEDAAVGATLFSSIFDSSTLIG